MWFLAIFITLPIRLFISPHTECSQGVYYQLPPLLWGISITVILYFCISLLWGISITHPPSALLPLLIKCYCQTLPTEKLMLYITYSPIKARVLECFSKIGCQMTNIDLVILFLYLENKWRIHKQLSYTRSPQNLDWFCISLFKLTNDQEYFDFFFFSLLSKRNK